MFHFQLRKPAACGVVPPLGSEEPPAEVEAHHSHPGKRPDECEESKIADQSAGVAAEEEAGLVALLGASQMKCGRCNEEEKKEEAGEEGGEDNVDEDDLAGKVVVAGNEPIDKKCKGETSKTEDGTCYVEHFNSIIRDSPPSPSSIFVILPVIFGAESRLGEHHFLKLPPLFLLQEVNTISSCAGVVQCTQQSPILSE